MKTNTLYQIFIPCLLIAFLFTNFGCDNDLEPTKEQILVSSPWTLNKASLKYSIITLELYDSLPDCAKDDYLEFVNNVDSGGQTVIYHEEAVCEEVSILDLSGNWEFIEKGTKLNYTPTEVNTQTPITLTFDVVEFSSLTLKIRVTESIETIAGIYNIDVEDLIALLSASILISENEEAELTLQFEPILIEL